MRFMHKLSCFVIAVSLFIPYTAFAEKMEINSNIATLNVGDISLFSDSSDIDMFAEPISEEDREFCEYLITEVLKHPDEVLTGSFVISAEHFIYVYETYFMNLLQYEHPELFFFDGFISYTYHVEDGDYIIDSLTPQYSNVDIDTELGIINAERDNIISHIDNNMTDLEKVLYVHDYIASNYDYDETYQSRTLDSMVREKVGVCQGYTYLFKYVMDELNIPCTTVPSNACEHIWNKVQIDGKWFNIDVTQDDPIPSLSSNINHKYFLVNDENLKRIDPYRTENGIQCSSHYTWNAYQWDGTPAISSSDSDFYYAPLRNISGTTVYKDKIFWAFNEIGDICKIQFENQIILREDYTLGRDSRWNVKGTYNSFWTKQYHALTLFNDDIYFNTPNKIYRYDTEKHGQGKAVEIYTYEDEHDPSNTYFYGLTVKDGKLLAEYSENPSAGAEAYVEIPVEVKPIETEKPKPEIELKEVSDFVYDEQDNSVKITVEIPDSITETLEAPPKVMVAQFDGNGVLMGIFEMDISENNTSSVNCEDNCSNIKTFIWSADNSPLALVSNFAMPQSADSN